MLRCRIELLPGGRESDARTIGLVEIANIGTKKDGTADYAVVLRKTKPFEGALIKAWRKGHFTQEHSFEKLINDIKPGEDNEAIYALASGHHRTKRGVYDLLFRALRACGLAERNSP